MTEVTLLATGSTGNAYYITDGKTRLLLDAGLVPETDDRKDGIEPRLARLGVRPESIDAVLISHSHGDHTKGLRSWVGRWGTPVWLTNGTYRALDKKQKLADWGCQFFKLTPERLETIGTMTLLPMVVPHDDPEPIGFCMLAGGKRLAFIADVGHLSASMVSVIHDAHYLYLEANHSLARLRANQELHESLRRRIEAQHLNNDQVAAFLGSIDASRMRHIVLGHLSAKNNSVPEVYDVVRRRLNEKGARAEVEVLGCGEMSTTTPL